MKVYTQKLQKVDFAISLSKVNYLKAMQLVLNNVYFWVWQTFEKGKQHIFEIKLKKHNQECIHNKQNKDMEDIVNYLSTFARYVS